MHSERFMRISEAAKLTGVHPNTIRNLERRGLLHPPRDWAGQRRFSEKDVARLRALIARPQGRTSKGEPQA